MKVTTKSKVQAALESKTRGTWWLSSEVQERVDELFAEQAPHKIERVLLALHSLHMAGEVELRIINSDEDAGTQRAQFALASGGSALRSTTLIQGLNHA